MILDKIQELKSLNNLIDSRTESESISESYKIRRDKILLDLEKEIEELGDFDTWKEWKNTIS